MAVYLENVLAELARLFPEDEYRVLVPGEARPGALPDAPNLELVSSNAPGILLNGAAAVAGRPRLDRLLGGPDLVWAPTIAPLALGRGVPFVLTVLDLSFAHRPRDYSAYRRLWHRLARARRLAERARWFSRSRRRCAASCSPVAARARAGPPRPARPRAGARPGCGRPARPRPTCSPWARSSRASSLACSWRRTAAPASAACTPAPVRRRRPAAQPPRALERTVLERVDDSELDSLYAGALCLACVSREEGFGFTPLEALAAGAPPVVSELDVFVETLGDAALRVPPGDPDALADALLRLQEEPDLRQRIVAAGRGGSPASAGSSRARHARPSKRRCHERAVRDRDRPARLRDRAGRAARLDRALARSAAAVVAVDSGSSDGGPALARERGASWWSCPATSASAPAAMPASSGCASP